MAIRVPRVCEIFNDSRARFYLATMLVFGIAVGMFGGVMNNYLFEILKIGKAERGMVEFPRELPGLLVIAFIAVLYRVPEMRILRLALMVSMAGMVGLSIAGSSRGAAIGMIVMWSVGEHLLMPVSPSVAMHMAHPGKTGLAMGAVGSVGNIGQVIGYYVIPLLFVAVMRNVPRGSFSSYQITFAGAAVVVGFALLLSTGIKSHGQVQRQRLRFDRKFNTYYILELLFGARKQVFITFAPYVLVVVYGARTELLATLYGACAVMNIFTSPLVGRMVDRFGYRRVLIFEAVSLFTLCVLYGFSHRVLPMNAAFFVICGVFILDSALFVVGMARSMYVKEHSSSQNEVTSTLSTGVSINHVVSILIALAGGVIWEKLGVEFLFTLSATFAVLSFVFCLRMPGRVQK